jgi:hypothetical protein
VKDRVVYRTTIDPPVRVGSRSLRTVEEAIQWLDNSPVRNSRSSAARGSLTKLADRLSPQAYSYNKRTLPTTLRQKLLAALRS